MVNHSISLKLPRRWQQAPLAGWQKPLPGRRGYLFRRRAVELGFTLLGCLLLLVIIPAIWLANWLLAPGPLFYWQTRVGQYGRHFTLIKFRSMVVNAEPDGAVWATPDDPRITVVGRFLRKTHLDELPQLWHVLTGEMSLIGPRPERPVFVAALTAQQPLYAARHLLKPGLTGWAQVHYHYSASVADALTKLEYDLYYLQYQSLWLDWQILRTTFSKIFRSSGR